MQRKTARTVEGCSYSFLCVASGRPSRYSSAWAEDEADIVGGCGREVTAVLPPYYHIRILGCAEKESERGRAKRMRRAVFSLYELEVESRVGSSTESKGDAPSERKDAPPQFRSTPV